MADVSMRLKWTGEGMQFDGGAEGGHVVRIDGSAATGASPVQMLLLAVGGCMAADIVDITGKMHVHMTGLEVSVEGDRAPEPPRRYTRIALRFSVSGVSAEDEPKLQRALDLSRETYCSVLHTVRPDVNLEFELDLA